MDDETRSQIHSLVDSERVVLFMKGVRGAPQCGFSATVCGILDSLIPDYQTVDVLADPALRDGIKAFSSWPTIPQLYVAGEFVGGCDIVQEMRADGSLLELLGVEAPSGEPPTLTITPAAAKALAAVTADADGSDLHLAVDARRQHGLYLGPVEEGELCVEVAGLPLYMDALSASRADGITIDAMETPDGPAFRIDDPGARAEIRQLSVRELKTMIDEGGGFELYDVRTPTERAMAHIEGSRLLDDDAAERLSALDRDAPLVFHCHHGGRSQKACEHFAALGFRNVANVVGGIDAWSQEIDPQVPRY